MLSDSLTFDRKCPDCDQNMGVSIIWDQNPYLYWHPFDRPLTDQSKHWHHIKPNRCEYTAECYCGKVIKNVELESNCWCGYIGEDSGGETI